MSQYLAELCTLLVEDTLGAFFAHIFSALTTYGRLEATQIAQRCRLPLRQIRHGLSVLVHAQLIYHHTSSDQRTSYEANLRAAYDLIRSGKIIQLAKCNLGEDAALVVAHILSVGQVTPKELHRFWKHIHDDHTIQNGGNSQKNRESHCNPTESAEVQPQLQARLEQGRSDLSIVLKRLVQNGFVLRLRRAHFCTPADNYFDAQSQLLSLEDGTTVKNRKSLDEMNESILEQMTNRNDASISLADFIHDISTSSKRPAASGSDSATRKKIKLTNGPSSGSHSAASNNVAGDGSVAETFAIRINHDKVAASLRNRRLIDKVRGTIGCSAAKAYDSVLQQSMAIPYRWQRGSEPKPEDEDFTKNFQSIDQESLLVALNTQDQYDDDEDHGLPSVIHHRTFSSGASHVHVNGYANGNHSAKAVQTVTMNDIKTHLLVLAQPPHKFVVQDPDSFRWTIDFQELCALLRREEALRLAKSRLNGVALRLVRVLLDKGKLDEKTLQEISLLSAKDLRQCLAKLKKNGFVGLQEVPREPQRQPLKTLYLWFYDSDRVRKMLLEDLYKAMTRLLRRLKVERSKVGPLLEKAERIDVRGSEEKFLAGGEMKVLDEWRRKEEWLLGEVERLDDSVAILRDV